MAVTIDDIARATGFHRTTVSKVLAGDQRCYASVGTRELIKSTANQMGFVPNYFARSLQRKSSLAIGLAGWLDIAGLSTPMFRAMTDNLRRHGYMPLFWESAIQPGDELTAIRELRERGVDGIIMHTETPDAELAAMLPRDFPMALIRYIATPGIACVVAERFQALHYGVHWLHQRGHRRIAFAGSGNRRALMHQRNTHRYKIEGYQAAMRELDLYADELLIEVGSLPGEPRDFVSQNPDLFHDITAVLCATDRIAVEIMGGLADLGLRVPHDCAIIGFDNTEFAMAVKPRLTSFEPRRAEVGARAVDMIMDLMAGKPVECITVTPELIERESA